MTLGHDCIHYIITTTSNQRAKTKLNFTKVACYCSTLLQGACGITGVYDVNMDVAVLLQHIHTLATILHIILSDKHIDRKQNPDTHKTLKERVSHISAFCVFFARETAGKICGCVSPSLRVSVGR